jgi:hypothetical protein
MTSASVSSSCSIRARFRDPFPRAIMLRFTREVRRAKPSGFPQPLMGRRLTPSLGKEDHLARIAYL